MTNVQFDKRHVFNSMSIASRLAIGFTLSAFLTLAVVTSALYWILVQGLESDERRLVINKIRMFETTLRINGDNMAILENEILLEGGVYWPDQHFVMFCRILDADLNVIIESPGMDDLVPVSAFPEPVEIFGRPDQSLVQFHTAPNEHGFYLMSVWARSGGQDGPLRLVQVAMDETGERLAMSAYYRDTLVVLFLGTFAFAAVGVVVSKYALKPIDNLARHTERITAQDTMSKVSPDSSRWPKELTALASSFYRMLDRIDTSFKWLSRCTEDMAHELRGPINRMMGEAEVTLSKDRDPVEYRRVLESNLEECDRLSRMIKELLFIAGAVNPHNSITRVELRTQEEFAELREFHDAQAQEQEVQIFCAGNVGVIANRAMFRRAVSNLISNSLSHVKEGDEIHLEARLLEDGSGVAVSVRDAGCGISSADLPYVFDRFYRCDRTRNDGNTGTGLGLSIVKTIMTLHGGTVSVESTEGAGTTATLVFPASVDEGEFESPEQSVAV